MVNEEVMEVTAEADQWGEIDDSEDELDPKQVTIGRQEELEFMVGRLAMFEFGSYEEAIQRGGKEPTTTKWVEGWKADDKGGRFVRCMLTGRDFKKKGRKKERTYLQPCHLWNRRSLCLEWWLAQGGGDGGRRWKKLN